MFSFISKISLIIEKLLIRPHSRPLTILILWNPNYIFHVLFYIFQNTLRGRGTKFLDFFLIGTSATKWFAGSRIFRYGLPQDILSKRQRKREGGAMFSSTAVSNSKLFNILTHGGGGGGGGTPPPPFFFSSGHLQQIGLQGREFSGMGCLMIF